MEAEPTINRRQEETVMQITTVGLDLAKNTFHLVGLDAQGREAVKRQMSRAQVLRYFANLPRCTVGMEACAGAHYFAREISRHGHEVKLIPPQYVKAYLRGQKNDYNDARAIAEAVRSPSMRFVAAKTVAQQDLQALARLREGVLRSRPHSSTGYGDCWASTGLSRPRASAPCAAPCPNCWRTPRTA